MMKVSSRSTYAIRALIDLGRNSSTDPVQLSKIADRQRIPLPYLEQIFSKLRKGGIVDAVRGPQGGYRLTKDPKDISLANIIHILEGPLKPVLCSLPENWSPLCHEVEGCVSRVMCNELDGELFRILGRNNLGQLCGEAKRLEKLKDE